jgi:hypothetical protein
VVRLLSALLSFWRLYCSASKQHRTSWWETAEMLKALGIILLIAGADAEFDATDPCITDCSETVWVLEINGHPVSIGQDMDEDECNALLAQIDPQAPGFSSLECVPYDVRRERI